MAREQEREEIERRRALPEEQRLKEDMEHAAKSREDKSKTKQKFLQKYWHKGAFHQVRLNYAICPPFISLYFRAILLAFVYAVCLRGGPD